MASPIASSVHSATTAAAVDALQRRVLLARTPTRLGWRRAWRARRGSGSRCRMRRRALHASLAHTASRARAHHCRARRAHTLSAPTWAASRSALTAQRGISAHSARRAPRRAAPASLPARSAWASAKRVPAAASRMTQARWRAAFAVQAASALLARRWSCQPTASLGRTATSPMLTASPNAFRVRWATSVSACPCLIH